MDSDAKGTELVSPIPQRAYAFVSLLGEDDIIVRPQSTPWAGIGQLVRPTSAPVSSVSIDKPMCYAIERPTSPFSRVTNPMVRDTLFRRACTGPDKTHPTPARQASVAGVREA